MIPELEFFKAEESAKIAKCTVHKSGKFGFSKGAEDLMNLKAFKSVKIAYDKLADDKSNILYMQLLHEEEEGAFKVLKAGSYYYTRVRGILEKLSVNYKDTTKTIIYDITEYNEYEQKFYKLTKRIINK